MKQTTVWYLLLVFGPFFWAEMGLSCAVCGFSEDSRGAFISTTALMTFVPLVVMAGIGFYIYRRMNQSEKLGDNGLECSSSDSDIH